MGIKTLLSPLLALALVAVSCGGEAGPGDEPGETAPPGGPAPATSLEITVWPTGEGEGEPVAYTLTCDPPGGDHPDPAAACAALQELGAEAFAPVPPDVMCTQIYGGPMQARVQGTVGGAPVDARLAYNDGCEIARWDALAAVVPGTEGGGVTR